MGTTSISLPVPAGNGVGATVAASTLGKSKQVVISGTFTATLIIEASGGGQFCQVLVANGPGVYPLDLSCATMRVRVSGYVVGSPTVEVGGDDAGSTSVVLPVPATTGVGAAVDISNLGAFLTAFLGITGGNFAGAIAIELGDGVGDWGQAFPTFQNAGCQSLLRPATFARVRRLGANPLVPGVPTVHLSGSPVGGGGGISVPIQYTIAGRETYDSQTPLSVGAISIDPSDISGFSDYRFVGVGARGDTVNATLELFDLTAGVSRATLTFTSTAPTRQQSAALALPAGARVLEARLYMAGVPGAEDSAELYSAYLEGTP